MPKPVHDLVDTLLDDPDFYPEKSEKEKQRFRIEGIYNNQC